MVSVLVSSDVDLGFETIKLVFVASPTKRVGLVQGEPLHHLIEINLFSS